VLHLLQSKAIRHYRDRQEVQRDLYILSQNQVWLKSSCLNKTQKLQGHTLLSLSLQLRILSKRKMADLATTTKKSPSKICALHRHTVKMKIQENIQNQKTNTDSIKEEDHILLRWRVHNTRRPLRLPKQQISTANYQPPPAMAWKIWRNPHTPIRRKRSPHVQTTHQQEWAARPPA
jgi:hypothetical protein